MIKLSIRIGVVMPIFSINKQQSLDHKRLKDLVTYHPRDGSFVWNKGRPSATSGNACGTVKPSGYVLICLDRKLFRAHRLAWFYVYGEWPTDEIDHINGIRNDNRICNLRVASKSENGFNKKMRMDCKTGAKGVLYYPKYNTYYVRFTVKKVPHTFGPFLTFEEAANVATEKRKSAHGEFFK